MALTTIKTMPLAAAVAALLLGSPARADDAPAGVTLTQFAYAGSGCSADSVTGNLPVDGNSFDILWTSFGAEVGSGVPMREKRKNCQVLLELGVPAGWQFAVESVEYHGDVKVDDAVEGRAGSAHYFQGDDATVRFYTLFVGPEDRAFRVTDFVDPANQVWSPCGGGRALNVNFEIRLDNSADAAAAGRIAFGDAGGLAGTHLELDWRACTL